MLTKQINEAREVVALAEREGRGLTTEEKALVDRALERGRVFMDEPVRPKVLSGSGIETPATEEPEGYKEAFREYLKHGVWSRALEVKAQSEGVDSEGGALVPNDFLNEIVVFLADAAPVLGAARVLDSATNVLDVPRLSSHGSAAWTGEGAAYNESDEVFDTLSITIHKATRLVKVSEELLADEKIRGLEGYLAEEFGRSLGALVNTALTTGDGTGKPYGFVPRVPAGNIEALAATNAVTADELKSIFRLLPPQYRSRASWMMSDATAASIDTLKDGNQRYLWQDSIAAGQPPTLMGRPVIVNPDMADMAASAKSIAFGDFRGFFVARRPSVAIRRLTERYADTGQVGFIANVRIGADLADTKAIVLGQNAAA